MSTKKMEELLDLGPIQTERIVPGTQKSEVREFCYISNKNQEKFEVFFDKLVSHVTPPIAKNGGVMINGCKITLPNGEVFEAISYKGDIEGWRLQIKKGAKALNAKLACIDSDCLMLEDNQSFPLIDCKVDFE